jgi:hypothetical protein
VLAQKLDSFFAGMCRQNLEPITRQKRGEALQVVIEIIDEQELHDL